MSCHLYASTLDGIILTLDCATGSPDLVLDLRRFLEEQGLASLRDIACHGGTMWGVAGDSLIRISTRTGDATVIGATGFSGVNALAVASTGIIYSATDQGDFLWIDPTTGAGTLIGTYGIGGSNADLVFDSNDLLFAAVDSPSVLARVDVATGSATAIGPIGPTPVTGLAFYCCRLYGVTLGGLVLTINPYDGTSTVIGAAGSRDSFRLSGLATCCGNCGCGC